MERIYNFIQDVELRIYKEFALESSNNLHIESIDLQNPLGSILRIYLSDIISSQIESIDELPLFFLPTKIVLTDKGSYNHSYISFSIEGVEFFRKLFFEYIKLNKTAREEKLQELRLELLMNKSGFLNRNSEFTEKDTQLTEPPLKSAKDSIKFEFNNTNDKLRYPDVPESEKVNYWCTLEYDLISLNNETPLLGFDKNFWEGFANKLFVLALQSKRNKKNFNDLKISAIRSAISAVMSRNMSHNMGSHSLAKLSSPEVLRAIDNNYGESSNKIQYKLFKEESGFPNQFIVKENVNKTKDQLISTYFSFAKTRMDLIADIVTSVPTLETTRKMDKDLMKPFRNNLLLNNTISGTSSFKYDFFVKSYGYDREEIDEDVLVSIPNDLLGCHAFYIILENIVRNCAKHGGGQWKGYVPGLPDKPQCNITIELNKKPELLNHYEIRIYDNSELDNRRNCRNRNQDINLPVLDDDKKLRSKAWGVLEMKVAAAYLRKINIENIDQSIFDACICPDGPTKGGCPENYICYRKKEPSGLNPCLLESFCNRVDGSEFGYKFYLLKPKELMIIDLRPSDAESISSSERAKLMDLGILVLDYPHKSGERGKEYFYDRQVIDTHKYLLLLFDEDSKKQVELVEEIIKNDRTKNPFRILCNKDIGQNSLKLAHLAIKKRKEIIELLFNDPEGFLGFVRLQWNKYLMNKKGIRSLELRNHNYSRLRHQGKDSNRRIRIENNAGDKTFIARFTDHTIFPQDIEETEFDESGINPPKLLIDYCEPLGSNQKNVITHLFVKQDMEIVESSLISIAIIDERIQELAEKQEYHGKASAGVSNLNKTDSFRSIWERARCYIPSIEADFDLNAEKYGKNNEENSIISKILIWISLVAKSIDFFIIHLGILEKMCALIAEKDSIFIDGSGRLLEGRDLMTRFIELYIQQDYEFQIIITSGRGEPHNLPKDLPFLNYSIIAQYVLENRNKYLLTQLLFSARRR